MYHFKECYCMNFDNFSEKEKRIFTQFLMDNQTEQFELIEAMIEERIRMSVPDMIKEYINQNPQEVVLDTREAENQLSNLFKHIRF